MKRTKQIVSMLLMLSMLFAVVALSGCGEKKVTLEEAINNTYEKYRQALTFAAFSQSENITEVEKGFSMDFDIDLDFSEIAGKKEIPKMDFSGKLITDMKNKNYFNLKVDTTGITLHLLELFAYDGTNTVNIPLLGMGAKSITNEEIMEMLQIDPEENPFMQYQDLSVRIERILAKAINTISVNIVEMETEEELVYGETKIKSRVLSYEADAVKAQTILTEFANLLENDLELKEDFKKLISFVNLEDTVSSQEKYEEIIRVLRTEAEDLGEQITSGEATGKISVKAYIYKENLLKVTIDAIGDEESESYNVVLDFGSPSTLGQKVSWVVKEAGEEIFSLIEETKENTEEKYWRETRLVEQDRERVFSLEYNVTTAQYVIFSEMKTDFNSVFEDGSFDGFFSSEDLTTTARFDLAGSCSYEEMFATIDSMSYSIDGEEVFQYEEEGFVTIKFLDEVIFPEVVEATPFTEEDLEEFLDRFTGEEMPPLFGEVIM